MQPIYENIYPRREMESFVAYEYQSAAFPFNWHYHPEYELTLITRGSGKRLVGDHFDQFETGDLVLLGTNLPHTWVSAPGQGNVSSVVIQFTVAFIESFLQFSECKNLRYLLDRASRGLQFNRDHKSAAVSQAIRQLPKTRHTSRITGLLHILEILGTMKPVALTSAYYSYTGRGQSEQRINKVCRYLYDHYCEPLHINEAAKRFHLSPSAFCKFFRKYTGKTFSDYVNDLRVGHVCDLLVTTDKSIATVAYEAGFESLTYFNRVFFKKKQVTPRAFRKQWQPPLPE